MGVDLEKGEQVDVEEVLRRWDPVGEYEYQRGIREDGMKVLTSKVRETKLGYNEETDELYSQLIGFSKKAVEDCLPHLDTGDAVALCETGGRGYITDAEEVQARGSIERILSGRCVLMTPENAEGSMKPYGPWSTRYVGHQFGSWAGQLGDGRAISIMETVSEGGGRQEIQLKGAGRTPFSRTADGLAVLRSGVREFLGCEGTYPLMTTICDRSC
jgi:hypothetical protein